MERKWFLKILGILLLVGVAVVASLPNFIDKPKDGADSLSLLRGWFPGVTLGLDLQGGMRLVYEVQVDSAIEDKRDQLANAMVQTLAERAEINGVKFTTGSDMERFDLVFPSAADRDSKEVAEALKDYRHSVVTDSGEGNIAHMRLKDDVVENTRDLSVKQAVETIDNRIDELGLVNTSVIPRGEDIMVEIPADQRTAKSGDSSSFDERQVARIKRIISMTARLEFKIVDESGSRDFFTKLADKIAKDSPIKLLQEQQRAGDEGVVTAYYLQAKDEPKGRSGRQLLKEFLKDVQVPADRAIGFEKEVVLDDAGNPTADVSWRTYYLNRVAGITGEYIENAMVQTDDTTGQPYVSLSFNSAGAKLFGDLTEKNVKRRMAIQLDDRVQSAPIINEKIPGGQCKITLGQYESFQSLYNQAQDLVVVLRAGALPAPLKPVTESTMGPTLGLDAIGMGKLATIVSAIAVFLFMILYYKMGGVAADLALFANIIFIFGTMSALGATLTLPGIAGFVLTLGMAVDANVIIFERIREELRGGKSPRAAVEAGYKRAFWTIFDSQLTTAIAGIVMLQYGTGAIKGFAVTLLIGILSSTFTAIVISRLVFDWMTRRRTDHLSV